MGDFEVQFWNGGLQRFNDSQGYARSKGLCKIVGEREQYCDMSVCLWLGRYVWMSEGEMECMQGIMEASLDYYLFGEDFV